MTDAPERIWAWVWNLPYPSKANGRAEWSASDPDPRPSHEYIRADLSPSPEVVKELVDALELADAALSGADIDMKHVWRKIKSALANAKLEGGE